MRRWQIAGGTILTVVVAVWLVSTNGVAMLSLATREIRLPGPAESRVRLVLADSSQTSIQPPLTTRWSGVYAAEDGLVTYDEHQDAIVKFALDTGQIEVVHDRVHTPPIDVLGLDSGRLLSVHSVPPGIVELSQPGNRVGDWSEFVAILSMDGDSARGIYGNVLRTDTRGKGELIRMSPDGEIELSWGSGILGRLSVGADGMIHVLNLAHFQHGSPRQFYLVFDDQGRRILMRRLSSAHQVLSVIAAPDGGAFLFSRAGRWLSYIDGQGKAAGLVVRWEGDDWPAVLTVKGDKVYAILNSGVVETYRFEPGAGHR